MINGKKLITMSLPPKNLDGSQAPGFFEYEHHNVVFKQYLPAGPVEHLDPATGEWVIARREKDIIQFYRDPGGLATVLAEDVVIP